MNIETKKTGIKFDEVIAGYGSEVLAETDIILDDTLPDIHHILQVDVLSHIKEKDVTNDKIILRGDVDITVLYVPDPKMSDAPAKSVKARAGFTDVCQATGVTADMKVQCFSSALDPDYTLINSRKINIKSIIHTQFKASRPCESVFISDIESDSEVESLKKQISVFRQESSEDFEISVSDKIEFPTKCPLAAEILKIDASISGNDAKLLADKCVIKGICHVNTLYLSSANMDLEFMEYEIPFTEVLDIPGISEEMDADIDYTVVDIYHETDDTGDGISSIGVEVKLAATVNISGEENTEILSDCYSPHCEMYITAKECCIDKIFSVSKPQILIKGDIFTDETYPPIARICNICAKPYIDSITREENLIILEGHLQVHILYLTADSTRPLCTLKDSIPFSYSINSDCPDDFVADCCIHLENISYTLPNENTVSIRAGADASVKIICKEKINVIDDITVSESTCTGKSSIVIYFVQPGDSMWNIAKKYKTSMEKIALVNNISNSALLTPGTKLLIPTT